MKPELADISKYHKVWIKMAFKILRNRNRDEANELVQEMYLKLYEFFEKKDVPSVSSLYVYKVLRNLFYNKVTKVKKEYSTEDMAEFDRCNDDDDNYTLEIRKVMAEALDEIPYLEREILLQHQEKSQRQLQKETGVCRDRLRVHKNRGMKKLETIVKEKFKTEIYDHKKKNEA